MKSLEIRPLATIRYSFSRTARRSIPASGDFSDRLQAPGVIRLRRLQNARMGETKQSWMVKATPWTAEATPWMAKEAPWTAKDPPWTVKAAPWVDEDAVGLRFVLPWVLKADPWVPKDRAWVVEGE